jgi:integrase
MQVLRTVSRIRGRGYVVTEPKTAKGRRRVMLPGPAVEVLKQHRVRQLEMRLKVGNEWQENDLVFCNMYGRYQHPDHMVEQFQRLLKDAGLPHLRFHDLRHSAATLLLAMGVHPKVVQELLGHSDIGVTMDIYSHVLPSMQKDAMDKWNEMF